MPEKSEILKNIVEAVVNGDDTASLQWCKEAVGIGMKPYEVIIQGLAEGMKIVGDKYEAKEYSLPEMLLSSDAVYAGLNYLLPMIPREEKRSRGKVVVGVVEGDVHDIGKNILKAMLVAAGYEVVDLGRDVPTDNFVETAQKEGAQVIAMSTLMTPTLMSMKTVEDKLKETGMKDSVKTIVGGSSVTDDFAKEIGSDAYAKDAMEGVDKVKLLLDQIKAAIEMMKKSEKGQ